MNQVSSRQQNMQAQESPPRTQDGFSKYSNDVTRMKKLLLKENNEEFDIQDFASRNYGTALVNSKFDDTQKQEGCPGINSSKDSNPQDDTCSRKTRLSFELHPMLILEDVWGDLSGDEDAPQDMDDDSDLLELLSILDAIGR